MAFVIADRVRETSTTTGTGNFTLAGAVTGYQTFDAALDTGDTTYYTIADQSGVNWEVGIGTFTSPSTLARTTILSSSNGGSVVTFTSGTKDVFISLPASKTNVEDQPNLIEVNSSSAALRITQTGAGNALVVEDGANPDSTPFVIDQFGAVVVGGTSSSSATISGSNQFAMVGTTAAGAKQGLSRWDNSTGPFSVQFAKSRSGTIGTQTVVSSGDSIAQLEFFGSDGTAFIEAARITAAVDGTPGTNDMPGRLVFNTTADGASTTTERMRIDSSGNVGIGTTAPTVYGTYKTLEVKGTGGGVVQFGTGSTTAAYVYSDGTNSGFNNLVSGYMNFATAGTERMRIDSSGNVGIGTSSPTYKLQVGNHNGYNDQFSVYNDGTFSTGGVNLFNYYNGTTNICGFKFASVSSTTGAILMYTNAGSGVVERARIDSNGNVQINTTNAAATGTTCRFTIEDGTIYLPFGINNNAAGTGASNVALFARNGTTTGTISVTGTTTAYNTSSDYRLKHDVQPMLSGLSTIAALKPSTYKWNADNSYGEGFIAHELQAVIPQAVTGEKDAVNDDGSIKPQGVDYSKVVVHLVAAIQELKGDFDAYKAAHP
jgi:hypothetical protein